MDPETLFVSAGDPSGDNAAARVISALRRDRPNLQFFGLGGPRLKFLKQEQFAESSDLAVLGFWEVAKRYFFFRKLMYRTVDEIKRRRPKLILLVDYPGFNLRLARRIRSLGIPILYYIAPQVWAWGRGRIGQMREDLELMLTILPFEQTFFQTSGISCRFVGHYLLEDIEKEQITSPIPGSRQIALLPGSRSQEIDRMLLPMLQAAEIVGEKHGTKAVITGIEGAYDYEKVIKSCGAKNVTVLYDEPRRVIFESDLAITASGTATLECGIIGRPMVIIYKTGMLTYQIAKRLVKLDKIGLVNLVLGDSLMPELIQNQATPRAIAEELEKYLLNDRYREEVAERLKTIPLLLGGVGASERVAEAIVERL